MGDLLRPTISRRGMLRAALHVGAGLMMGSVGLGWYGTRLEPDWLKLERISVPILRLPPAFDGYRLAQITDIHLGPATKRSTIRRAIDMALDLAPDVIVLTGDYVTQYLDADALHAELSRLHAPDGVWGIMGNHDHWVDAPGVRDVLGAAGVKELWNTSLDIWRGDAALWFVGLDDIWENEHDLDLAIEEVPLDACAILLAHEPDYADVSAPTGRFALQLSGHSHGGQLRIPGIGAPFTPHLGQKYPYGLRRIGDMWLYTSRGVGQNQAIRVNCRPEVTEITLLRA